MIPPRDEHDGRRFCLAVVALASVLIGMVALAWGCESLESAVRETGKNLDPLPQR